MPHPLRESRLPFIKVEAVTHGYPSSIRIDHKEETQCGKEKYNLWSLQ